MISYSCPLCLVSEALTYVASVHLGFFLADLRCARILCFISADFVRLKKDEWFTKIDNLVLLHAGGQHKYY